MPDAENLRNIFTNSVLSAPAATARLLLGRQIQRVPANRELHPPLTGCCPARPKPHNRTIDSDRSKRLWYQFRLQTLLIAMVVLCVVFAWIGWRMQRARENRKWVVAPKEVAAAIEELGGRIEYEYDERRPQTWLERQFDDPGDPDDPVRVLIGTGVSFRNVKVTDAGLKRLKGLKSLQGLDLESTNVTDAGLEHLKGQTNLKSLVLAGTSVTDSRLERLKELTNLQYLFLTALDVTDVGLVHLEGLTKLLYLDPPCRTISLFQAY